MTHHHPRTDRPDACRWCGYPLPPREPGKRGRPPETHEGECRRLYSNRRNLDYRIERFCEAVAAEVDRSAGEVAGTIPADVVGMEGDSEAAPLRQRLEDGGIAEVPDPTQGLHGDALMWAVEAWEERLRVHKQILQADEEIALEEREPYRVDPDKRLRDGRRVGDLTDEETAEVIRQAVARRRARGSE